MAKVKNEHYITIQEFMVNDLGLSGNELIAYALIYGFSQDGESYFKGSLSYVAKWLNCSKATACTILNKLADDGFLEKKEKNVNGVRLCDYTAYPIDEKELKEIKERKKQRKEKEKTERYIKKLNTPSKNNNRYDKNLNEGIQKTLNHNTKDNKDENINTNSKANSFFVKKVGERKRTVNQDELLNRIHNVMGKLREEIFGEEQANNLENCFTYFIERYAEVFGRKHPVLKERTIFDLGADLTEDIYIDRGKFETHFYPLVSDEPDDNSYESVIDLYFETEFKEDIDYSVVHFSQKNVLTKLMGHDTSHEWFTNES